MLLIKIHKISLIFQQEKIVYDEKIDVISIFKEILNEFNLNKMIMISDLNEIFVPDLNELDVNNKNIYITLFNIVLQEWESEDNLFSYKIQEVLNYIVNSILMENNSHLNSSADMNLDKNQEIFISNLNENENENLNEENNIFINSNYPIFEKMEITNRNYLKEYIIRKNLKEYKCNCCGLSDWQNNPLPLQLWSKNNIYSSNNLNNLVFLCPNCYSLFGD